MKIIITGSLGHISKPLATELVQKGHTVTVISSKPEKQQEIEALGAIAAIGSVEDTDFLTAVFTGADAVYAMVPPNFTAPDSRAYCRNIGSAYVKAIRQANVKHVVHLSSWGAHLDKGTGFILGSHDVECLLDELAGVSIMHLRPASFYYNLYHYIPMIKAAGFIGTNYGDEDKLTMVSTADIAAVAAEELEGPGDGISIRYIASDEHTCTKIAGILGAAIGKPDLKWITLTDQQVQETLEKNGMPTFIAAQMVELNASIHSGKIREDYDLHKRAALGKVKLEDFAKEFAAAF